ncbi:MAG: hypothetical protein RLZZ74_2943 [Cyanobacteriota bacterium]|jgi:hypothetical protein
MIIRDIEYLKLVPLTDEKSKALTGGFFTLLAIPIGAGIAEKVAQESGLAEEAGIPPGQIFADTFNKGTDLLNPFDGNLFG